MITRNTLVRAKRARENNIALFDIICPDGCVVSENCTV